MAVFHIVERIVYQVEADTPQEAEDRLVNAEDRDEQFLCAVQDRKVIKVSE